MKKLSYLTAISLIVILTGFLVASNVIAEAAEQMTALEKKLYEAAKAEGNLIWWDAVGLKPADGFMKAFNKRYPGIKVEYYNANAPTSDEKYFSERKAGMRPADILHVDWYLKFKQEDLITDLRDIIKDTGYPTAFVSPNFDAIGIEHTVKLCAYNTNLVAEKDVPRSWDDLLLPKWKDRIAMNYQCEIFTFLTSYWGEKNIVAYLSKLKKQNPIFTENTTKSMTLLGAGEYPFATDASLGVILQLQKKGVPIAGVPISPVVSKFTPHVLVRDAPHPNAARLYLRWLMTAEGQMLVDELREKGNPLPGSGSSQSKAIEKLGVKLLVEPAWEEDVKPIQLRYQKVIGYTK